MAVPVRQTVWGKLAAGNFTLGAAGAGLYVLGLPLALIRPADLLQIFEGTRIISPILVVAGLLCVAAEAGRPLRGMNALLNLRRSWMSRELLAASIFVAFSAGDLLLSHHVLRWVSFGAAAVLVLSQGFMLAAAKGIPAWNTPLMPLLFFLSGLLKGAGILLASALIYGAGHPSLLILGSLSTVLAALDLVALLSYMFWPGRTRTFDESIGVLRRKSAATMLIIIGHVLPIAILVTGVSLPSIVYPSFAIAASLILAGGSALKYSIVVLAGFFIAINPWHGR